MRAVSAVLVYWGSVVSRAFWDALEFAKHDLKKTLLTAIVIFAAASAFSKLEGTQQAIAKIEWWALGLLAEFALILITFLIFIMRTPLLLQIQKVDETQRELNARISKISDEAAESRKTHEALSKHQESQIRELRDAMDRKSVPLDRVFVRSEIQKRFDECKALGDAIRAGNADAIHRLITLEHQTNVYIRQKYHGYNGFNSEEYPIKNSFSWGEPDVQPDVAAKRWEGRIKLFQIVIDLIDGTPPSQTRSE